jgi:hypothetical protein
MRFQERQVGPPADRAVIVRTEDSAAVQRILEAEKGDCVVEVAVLDRGRVLFLLGEPARNGWGQRVLAALTEAKILHTTVLNWARRNQPTSPLSPDSPRAAQWSGFDPQQFRGY